MLWDVSGQEVDVISFERFEPQEVFIEIGLPLFFLVDEWLGHKRIAYVCGVFDGIVRHLVVACKQSLFERLVADEVTMWQALNSGVAWIVDAEDTEDGYLVKQAWSVEIENLPRRVLPDPYMTINKEIVPLLVLKGDGPELSKDGVPVNSANYIIKSGQNAIRPLVEFAYVDRYGDYNHEEIKQYCNVEVKETKAASFEVSFGLKGVESLDVELLNDVIELASIGVGYFDAICNRQLDLESMGEFERNERLTEAVLSFQELAKDKQSAILKAMKFLTPPQRGDIKTMSVGGMFSTFGDKVDFDRDASKQVKDAISKSEVDDSESFYIFGKILGLRDGEPIGWALSVDSGAEYCFYFEASMRDELIDFFKHKTKIVMELDPSSYKSSTRYELVWLSDHTADKRLVAQEEE